MTKQKTDEQLEDNRNAPHHEGPPDEGPATTEGKYHGFSQRQIDRIQAERDPGPAVPTDASASIDMPAERDNAAELERQRAIDEQEAAALNQVDAKRDKETQREHSKHK